MNFERALFLLPGLVIGLTVHEAAHAISAKWLGDRTAEKMGRVSLNPLRHLSLYGTLALFFLGFGWGKPVIVNLYNFKKPKFYYLLSSLAGPASNLLICGVCLGVLYMQPPETMESFLMGVYLINGMLAAINLVPIPPLDGSKIWPCLIPGMKPAISGKWSMVWVVVLVVAMYTGGISKVLGPVQGAMWKMLPGFTMPDIETERPEGFPEALVAPEGVRAAYVFEPDINVSVVFGVEESSDDFPTYLLIEKRLREFGWGKMKYKLDQPEEMNDGKWGEVKIKDEEVRKLHEFWVNPGNEIISVLCIENEEVKEGIGIVVFLSYYSDPVAQLDKFIAYRELHAEEFIWVE